MRNANQQNAERALGQGAGCSLTHCRRMTAAGLLLACLANRSARVGVRALAALAPCFGLRSNWNELRSKIRRPANYQIFCENINLTTSNGSLSILAATLRRPIYSKCAQARCVPVFYRILRAAAETPHGCEFTRPGARSTCRNSRQRYASWR